MTGFYGGDYFNNGIGYGIYLQDSVKDFEEFLSYGYFKYSNYLKTMLLKYQNQFRQKQKNNRNVIDSPE